MFAIGKLLDARRTRAEPTTVAFRLTPFAGDGTTPGQGAARARRRRMTGTMLAVPVPVVAGLPRAQQRQGREMAAVPSCRTILRAMSGRRVIVAVVRFASGVEPYGPLA